MCRDTLLVDGVEFLDQEAHRLLDAGMVQRFREGLEQCAASGPDLVQGGERGFCRFREWVAWRGLSGSLPVAPFADRNTLAMQSSPVISHAERASMASSVTITRCGWICSGGNQKLPASSRDPVAMQCHGRLPVPTISEPVVRSC